MIPLGLAAALAVGVLRRRRQLRADPAAAHPADHRHAVGELHHPVDRHRLGRGLQIKPPPGFADFTERPRRSASRCSRSSSSLFAAVMHVVLAPDDLRPLGDRHRPEPARRVAGRRPGRAGPLRGLRRCPRSSPSLGGILLAGFSGGAALDIGNEYLLTSIAVVVIGGTSVAGGNGNVPGPLGRVAVPVPAHHAQHVRRRRRRAAGR